jgi:isoquinoline 1-oxidoreductase beta subunit
LVVELAIPLGLTPALAQVAPSTPFAPNAFIRVSQDNIVTLVMPMVEMGQGVYTAMAMLLAEELEVGLDQVRIEHAPADDGLYANAILQSQTTGLSSTVRAFWLPLRQAGATARTPRASAPGRARASATRRPRARAAARATASARAAAR